MTNWGNLKVTELKEELKSRGLSTTGRKADLVSRLESFEAEQNAEVNEEEAAEGAVPEQPEEQVNEATDSGPEAKEDKQEEKPTDVEVTEPVPQSNEQPDTEAQKELAPVGQAGDDSAADQAVAESVKGTALEAAEEPSPAPETEASDQQLDKKASKVGEHTKECESKEGSEPAVASAEATANAGVDDAAALKETGADVEINEGVPSVGLEKQELGGPEGENNGREGEGDEPASAAKSRGEGESRSDQGLKAGGARADGLAGSAGAAGAGAADAKGGEEPYEKNLLDELVGGDEDEDMITPEEVDLDSSLGPKQRRPEGKSVNKESPAAVNAEDDASVKVQRGPEDQPVKTVPPASREPTRALRIDNFVRPFTKQLLEQMLSAFGELKGIWLAPIKTHCYAIFESEEVAEKCRQGTYDLEWPEGHGKRLVPRFVALEEAEAACAGKPVGETTGRASEPKEPTPGKGSKDRGRLFTREEAELRRAASGSKEPEPNGPRQKRKRQEEPPQVLEDLFRKTATKPAIYWLPLTEEQVDTRKARRAALEAQSAAAEEKAKGDTKPDDGAAHGRERKPERGGDGRDSKADEGRGGRERPDHRHRRSPDRRESPPRRRPRSRSPERYNRRR